MPRVHQFLPLTKTSKQSQNLSARDRGNISIISVAWLALTALACSALVVATAVVRERAYLQHSADVVTLAFAQRGERDAQRLAEFAGVSIVNIEQVDSSVTVTIRNRHGLARASAHR